MALEDIEFQIDDIHSWSDLTNSPKCGSSGILVRDVTQNVNLQEFVEYFEDAGGKISFVSTMQDGVFLSFASDEDLSSLLGSNPSRIINLNGHNLIIFPKVVPGLYTERLVLLTEIKVTTKKYIAMDLANAPLKVSKVEQITDNAFMVFLPKTTDCDKGKDILNQFFSGKSPTYKFEKLCSTDCLKMTSSRALTNDFIKEISQIFTDEITNISLIDDKSALIFCSNSAQLENTLKKLQEKVANAPVSLKQYFDQFEKVQMASEQKSGMDLLCKTWKGFLEGKTQMQTKTATLVSNKQIAKFSDIKLKLVLIAKIGVKVQTLSIDGTRIFLTFENENDAAKFYAVYPKDGVHHRLGQELFTLTLQTSTTESATADRQTKTSIQKTARFSGIYNWFEESTLAFKPHSKGILVLNMTANTSPDEIRSHFQREFSSHANRVTEVLPLTDGLFLNLKSAKGIEKVLQKEHVLDKTRLDLYEKIVPDFFKNKLIMKNTPDKLDDIILLTLTNLSPKKTHPVNIQRFETNASQIQYDDESDVHDMEAIKGNANRHQETRDLKISLLRKTDCLKVKKLEGSAIEDAQPILQSKITKNGKITRFDIISSDYALAYFSNYKDAENIFENTVDHIIKYGNFVFELELYYHCFSKYHLRPKEDNLVDKYYRKWTDEKFKTNEFYVSIKRKELYSFLRQKQRHVEELSFILNGRVTVKLHEDESCLVLNPAISGIGKGPQLADSFESTCRNITNDFLEKYCSSHKIFPADNLKIVRKLQVNPTVAEDYDGSDLHDISVKWTGENRNEAIVTGVKNEVESFINSITQLIDVKSDELSVEAAKYRWLLDCEVLSDIEIENPQVQIIRDDDQTTFTFRGQENEIMRVRLQIFECLEKVTPKKPDIEEEILSFIITTPEVTEDLKLSFKSDGLKAIVHIRDNIPGIWSKETDMEKAESLLKKKFLVDKSIALTTLAHKNLLEVDKWKTLIRSFDSKSVLIKLLPDAVLVYGFNGDVKNAVKRIKHYFQENLCCCETLKLDYIKAVYLRQYFSDKFDSVKWFLDHEKKAITFVGNSNQVQEAKRDFEKEEKKLLVKSYQKQDKGIFKMFYDDDRKFIRGLVAGYNCSILIGAGAWPLQDSGQRSFSFMVDFLVVISCQITLPWDDSDACICFTNQSAAAGIVIDGISNLDGKFFFRVPLMHNKSEMATVLFKSLEEADKLKCKSISFPVDKCVSLSHCEMADIMMSIFIQYVGSGKKSVERVRILIIDHTKFNEFTKSLANFRQGQQQQIQTTFSTNRSRYQLTSRPSSSQESSLKTIGEITSQTPDIRGDTRSSKINLSNSYSIGNLNVLLYEGDITEESTDLIVNSLGSAFDLRNAGIVSKMILKKGGVSIQTELSNQNEKEIRITSAGNLSCQKILHISLSQDSQKLKGASLKILNEAEKQKFTSISLPAIGTGGHGFKSSTVAKQIVEALEEFSAKNPLCLKHIRLVIFQSEMIPNFSLQLSSHSRLSGVNPLPGTKKNFLKSSTLGCVTVSIRQGNIINEKNDAILNTLGSKFDLSNAGALSKKILENGGSVIQSELSNATGTDFRITQSGRLDCKHIVHLVVPSPQNASMLRKLVYSALMEIEKRQMKSISLPALGTGAGKISSSNSAQYMLGGVKDYCDSQPQYLKKIDFVIFEQKMVQDFEAYLSSIVRSQTVPSAHVKIQKVVDVPTEILHRQFQTRQSGSLQICLRCGDITEEDTEIIVNSIGRNLDLLKSGSVSSAILKKGGQDIQAEILDKKNNDFIITSGGKLNCKKIFHVKTPSVLEELPKCIKTILDAAVSEKCTSISIPAIGTGGLNLPSKEVAKAIIEGIVKFGKKNDIQHLKVVKVVVYKPAMISDFERYLSKDTSVKSKFIKQVSEAVLTLRSLQIVVREGDFTQANAHVIVNAVDKDFAIGTLRKRLGDKLLQIQSEIKADDNKVLRKTASGDLPCKRIYHVAFPTDVHEIKDCILRVLNESERNQFSSIAFSDLSGNKVKPKVYAQAMLMALDEFSCILTNKHVKRVEVVIQEKTVLSKFSESIISGGQTLPDACVIENEQQDSINLMICCPDASNIDQAIEEIKNNVDSKIRKEIVQHEGVMYLTEKKYWRRIEEVKKSCRVNINLDKCAGATVKQIVINGHCDDSTTARSAVEKILNQISEAEKTAREGRYCWKYKDVDDKWKTFDAESRQTLEKTYQEDFTEKPISVTIEAQEHSFTFHRDAISSDMKLKGLMTCEIKREIVDDFPSEWDDMGSDMCKLVTLDTSSREYANIQNEVQKTVKNCQILKISRVQNSKLYPLFYTLKMTTEKRIDQKANRMLFHGTTSIAADTICRDGFNRAFKGRNATLFGEGSYFAKNANYSANSKYASPDDKGVCSMFYADVVTGHYTKGSGDMKTTPVKPNSTERYDSLVNDVANPTIFVTLHDAGAYPSYLIQFKLLG